jgi:uncharacterized protein YdhG (YjbR/CyaY superfamily)
MPSDTGGPPAGGPPARRPAAGGAEADARERIDAILAGLPDDQRTVLQRLREVIASTVPEAEEGFSYGVPAFRYRGRPLAAYAAAAKHCSYFPMSSEVIDQHRPDLEGFDLSKGTIRFDAAKPLPTALVTALVRARQAEIDAAVAR